MMEVFTLLDQITFDLRYKKAQEKILRQEFDVGDTERAQNENVERKIRTFYSSQMCFF